MSFEYPELALLLVPGAWLLWKLPVVSGAAQLVRGLILLSVVLAAMGPLWVLSTPGVDVILVADRSRSMPGEAEASQIELLRSLETGRGQQHRVGLVGFGQEARLEFAPSANRSFEGWMHQPNTNGSDLALALETALNVADPNRSTRVLVLSDGELTGEAIDTVARKAHFQGIPIDYRSYERPQSFDASVDAVDPPEVVARREPFPITVEVTTSETVDAVLTLARNGKPIAKQSRQLALGRNRFIFRDLVEAPGVVLYTARLEVANDLLPDNNQGMGVVRVESGPAVLVLNADGSRNSNLVRGLESGGMNVEVVAADQFQLSADELEPYRGVIIENVPAKSFARTELESLRRFVRDLGGGLLLTGGTRSFGQGGYFKSPLDDVLPVSMELKREHRKTRVAIAIALDRSGSMTAPVGGGRVKMDLANSGTAACVRMLSSGDSVAVIAVDSSPHVIQPLTDVDDPERLAQKVRGIRSEGGGIFVYEALVGAGMQLASAEQETKHIILFSDAADSEEPGDFRTLLAKYAAAGITVSVIGLGTEQDPDADLLKEIAHLGNGRVLFTNDAEELPRLFAEDTMAVTRGSFIKKDAETSPNGLEGAILPDLQLVGGWPGKAFPNVDGYNLCYLRDNATCGVITTDEFKAPLFAFWTHGLGRAGALTLELDGDYSGQFANWDQQAEFLVTVGRWLQGTEEPLPATMTFRRDGQNGIIEVELDPTRFDAKAGLPRVLIVPPADQGRGDQALEAVEPELAWTGPYTLTGRVPLDSTGIYRSVLKFAGRTPLRGPAVALPYSPEFASRIGTATGPATLASMAKLSGGTRRTDVTEVFADPPPARRPRSLLPYVLGAIVVLVVSEVAIRRWGLWAGLPDAASAWSLMTERARRRNKQVARANNMPWARGGWRSGAKPVVATGHVDSTASVVQPAAGEAPPVAAPAAESVAAESVYDVAKRRAKERRGG